MTGRPHAAGGGSSPGRRMAWTLRVVGSLLVLATGGFMFLSLLTALGAYNPYPAPPPKAAELPHFGRSASLRFDEIRRRPGEAVAAYERRLTLDVNAWMIHYWPAEDRRFVEVNPLVSLGLWLKSFVPGAAYFSDYEFVTPELAWNRGFGFCSQVSRIVYEMLLREGIASTIIQNDNHVVVEAGGRLLDADYGVIVPHTAAQMQADPALVETAYADFSPSWPLLKAVYAKGFTESASKPVFAQSAAYERQAMTYGWAFMLMMFWLTLAVADAGWCWPRFARRPQAGPSGRPEPGGIPVPGPTGARGAGA